MPFTFYATVSYSRLFPHMPNVPYLAPASSWARGLRKDGTIPAPRFPKQVQRVAADSGGFVATKIWGDYKYSPDQYVDWLDTFNPEWAATMDYCCEQEVAGTCGIVRQRQDRTSAMTRLFWQDYRDSQWAWTPTIQGWEVEDYVHHAREMKPLIREMSTYYARRDRQFRVGIGTLCARASVSMINSVVHAVSDELPGVDFHLWGVKLGALKSNLDLTRVVSADSAAWDRGGLGADGVRDGHERRAMGITQREYIFSVSLPRYLNKVEAAIHTPKQRRLL